MANYVLSIFFYMFGNMADNRPRYEFLVKHKFINVNNNKGTLLPMHASSDRVTGTNVLAGTNITAIELITTPFPFDNKHVLIRKVDTLLYSQMLY